MIVTDRDLKILELLTVYYVLSGAQIRRLVFPSDADGRISRRRVNFLLANKLINKTRALVYNPLRTDGAAVYYPSKAGCELLALRRGDVRYLLANTSCPAAQNLVHWTTLSDLHILVQASFALQKKVTLTAWINEFDIVNKDEVEAARRFRLYTQVSEQPKKIVCVPDAAFLISDGRYALANYIELECGTNSPNKAAAEKTPGYAGLAANKLHHRHFPGSLDMFRVLMFAPTANWRDALVKALATKERPDLWRVAALTDVKPETFLTRPIFYPATGGPPVALLKVSG